MNIEEIYVLNRAIDGKDIFSFPSFSKLKISDFLVDPIKDGLIRKGILENYGKFTNEGIVIIKRLKLFKEAKKRIRINNVSIGILNEKESVLILYNPLYDEYKILMSDTSNNVTQLLESYEFLQNPGIETEQLYEEE